MPLPVSSSTLGEELMGQEHDTFAWPAAPFPVHIHKLSEVNHNCWRLTKPASEYKPAIL